MEVVRKLAKAGHNVVAVFRQASGKADALKEELAAFDIGYLPLQAEMTDLGDVSSVIDRTIKRFGGIDSLVCTQGWIHGLSLFHEQSIEDMERYIDIELKSVLYACRAAIPHMIRGGGGRIVTVGSDSGKVGSTGEAVSSACRGGVIALSKALARELARHSITVNVVCPGPVDTGLLNRMLSTPGFTGKVMEAMIRAIPMRRPGRPEEVADVVAYLVAGDCAYITGQAVSVSGGLTMC